jgi:predicted DNA-binding transcriptional regulator YafY
VRADRLVATLLLLQARGQLTARELADELEVSLATARRDLEALSTAGVPVYAQPGRGGGWTLLGGARTDLSGLTAPEAQALFLLAGPASASTPALRSALRKLVRALPTPLRADAESAAEAVVLDPAGWGQLRPGRLDRIETVRSTDLEGRRPPDFDLSDAWQQVVAVVEEQRSLTWATVRVEPRFVFVLRGQFGRHCDVLEPAADGRARVRVAAPTPLMIAQHLAGWGALIQVEDAAEVCGELARLGAELVERYGTN